MSSLFDQMEVRRAEREASRAMSGKDSYNGGVLKQDVSVRFTKDGAAIPPANMGTPRPSTVRPPVHEEYETLGLRFSKGGVGGVRVTFAGSGYSINDPRLVLEVLFDTLKAQAEGKDSPHGNLAAPTGKGKK